VLSILRERKRGGLNEKHTHTSDTYSEGGIKRYGERQAKAHTVTHIDKITEIRRYREMLTEAERERE
jgi:hypothetical protein